MAIRTESGLKLTYDDYLLIPDDGLRHEILDGVHYVSAAPVPYHQYVSGRLFFHLYRRITEPGLGKIYPAPVEVHFAMFDVTQPDIVVVLEPNEGIIGPKKIEGPPDLVIEILSESTAKRDRTLKKERYRLGGIPEYWIVDPERRVVQQFVLEGEDYRLVSESADEVTFRGLPGVRIDLREVW
jgi:Uma2 family endonuclease